MQRYYLFDNNKIYMKYVDVAGITQYKTSDGQLFIDLIEAQLHDSSGNIETIVTYEPPPNSTLIAPSDFIKAWEWIGHEWTEKRSKPTAIDRLEAVENALLELIMGGK
ncbi:hypothetical protein ACFCVQ_12385 [Bacillus thuringiensis]|uniref:hypothetical protein n=1 Tax=Bacillus thuringiensis TaxID=1428 RepID=UPI002A3280AB|nr:hypothetical protein [Bacillus cereus]